MNSTKKEKQSIKKLFSHWEQSQIFSQFHNDLSILLEMDVDDDMKENQSL